jgi:alpha-galactosidase
MNKNNIAERTVRLLSAPSFALLLLLAFVAIAPSQTLQIQAQPPLLAPVPPMGWNSWDAYGTTVREDEVKANADVMAAPLKQFGWQYIVVDIQWYEPHAQAHGYRAGAVLSMDDYGRLIPAANRFPSSTNGEGFKQLADYVHSKGLKFGIHILRGIPRQAVEKNLPILGTGIHAAEIANTASVCNWNADMYGLNMSKPGAQAYYDSIVTLYATWGVDFIKADDMARPYHTDEIAALHQAILKSGRPIVLSLSPGPAPLNQVDDLRSHAEMWRIEDDLWDTWGSVKAMYKDAAAWLPLVAPGHWPDADMLPLGRIGIRAERGEDRSSRLTHDEQMTMMSMWSMLHSPLIFGGDLPSLDPFTRSLLTNTEVLNIDQHSSNATIAYSKDDLHIWTAKGAPPGVVYAALFNFSDSPAHVHMAWSQLGITVSSASIRELWTGETLRGSPDVDASVAAHGVVLYKIERHR